MMPTVSQRLVDLTISLLSIPSTVYPRRRGRSLDLEVEFKVKPW